MGSYEEEDLDTQFARKPRHASRVPDDIAEDIHRRLAATKVRHMCTQHECTATETTPCLHPNHRRDDDYLLSTDAEFPGMLDMLGLDSTWDTVTDAERRTWLRWIGQAGPPEELAA